MRRVRKPDEFLVRNDMSCRACQPSILIPRLDHSVESLSLPLAKVATGGGRSSAPREVGQLLYPRVILVPLKPP